MMVTPPIDPVEIAYFFPAVVSCLEYDNPVNTARTIVIKEVSEDAIETGSAI